MALKHIIWDWNGTLVNDKWLCIDGINSSLKKRELPTITEKRYMDIFTFPVEEYYKKVGFNFANEPFHVAGDEFVKYYGKYFHKVELHKLAFEIIKKIQAEGFTQSILSAGKQDYLINWVKHHGLFNYFSAIKGISDHYARGKLELGIKLVNELPYERSEIIMIGDTIHDSEVAREMKIDCILIDHGHVSRKRLIDTKRKVISNFEELFDILGF